MYSVATPAKVKLQVMASVTSCFLYVFVSHLQAHSSYLEKVNFDTGQGNILQKSLVWRAFQWDFMEQLQQFKSYRSTDKITMSLDSCQ
ncbi:hypothetical protein DV515_00000829 [Chloebia gouldiae]|uniref:Uncharacterized protein n=1 Tax=Chloebia gouldiae TaxID=44316 RepID=A0A3L8T1B5_CHLGU|nr:hypothetical protein DV515_00000829 [Chloebia gouldiae]